MNRTTTPTTRIANKAIVIGGSTAGLCAARVLSDRFDDVLIVDRDTLPSGATWRGQVPQGRHPHLLLTAGARLFEEWFPGIVAELEAGGAVNIDIVRDFSWYQGGGTMRRPSSGLYTPCMSRPYLERTVRARVERLANVTIRDGTAIDGLDTDSSGTRVTGVHLGGATVPCDLVVDATGRQARSLSWLKDLGYEPPRTSVVHVDMRYVTCVLRRGESGARDWQGAAVIGDPETRRLAMALPVEGDRWFVAFGGLNGESAPTDTAELRAYARSSFDSPVIADILEGSELLDGPVTHRFPSNQRRRVERLRRFPTGWVLLGDALSSFDPIYGQGMTSAAQQSVALGEQLDRAGAVDRSFARRYFRAAGRVVTAPWSIAVGGDFVYADTTGEKPVGTDLINRYMDRATIAAQHDDKVALRLNEVLALTRRPEALLAPGFVLRMLLAARRRPAGAPADVPVRDTVLPDRR